MKVTNEFSVMMKFCEEKNLGVCRRNLEILEHVDLSNVEEVSKAIEIINNAENTKYSAGIMNSVRRNLGLEKWDTSKDDIIAEMTPRQVFDRVCIWNGLGGYAGTIVGWIEEIYNIELDDKE